MSKPKTNRELIRNNTTERMEIKKFPYTDVSKIIEFSNHEIKMLIWEGCLSQKQANNLSQKITIKQVQQQMRKNIKNSTTQFKREFSKIPKIKKVTKEDLKKIMELDSISIFKTDWKFNESKSLFRLINSYHIGYGIASSNFTLIFSKSEPIENYKINFNDKESQKLNKKFNLEFYIKEIINEKIKNLINIKNFYKKYE